MKNTFCTTKFLSGKAINTVVLCVCFAIMVGTLTFGKNNSQEQVTDSTQAIPSPVAVENRIRSHISPLLDSLTSTTKLLENLQYDLVTTKRIGGTAMSIALILSLAAGLLSFRMWRKHLYGIGKNMSAPTEYRTNRDSQQYGSLQSTLYDGLEKIQLLDRRIAKIEKRMPPLVESSSGVTIQDQRDLKTVPSSSVLRSDVRQPAVDLSSPEALYNQVHDGLSSSQVLALLHEHFVVFGVTTNFEERKSNPASPLRLTITSNEQSLLAVEPKNSAHRSGDLFLLPELQLTYDRNYHEAIGYSKLFKVVGFDPKNAYSGARVLKPALIRRLPSSSGEFELSTIGEIELVA